jgi:hypothetical protein
MAMKQFIELGVVRMGAAIQSVCANVDFEVLSLPGGSLIALLLWLYATAMGPASNSRWSGYVGTISIETPVLPAIFLLTNKLVTAYRKP